LSFSGLPTNFVKSRFARALKKSLKTVSLAFSSFSSRILSSSAFLSSSAILFYSASSSFFLR